MINSNEVLNTIEEEEKVLMADEVISKIYLILKTIADRKVNDWQMDKLVDYVYTLCKLMYNLGDLKDDAYAIAQILDEEYDSLVRDEYIRIKQGEEKVSDKMADTLAKQKNESKLVEVLVAQKKARKLRSLYENCEKQISLTQTMVKTKVDDRIRANITTN